ncbi:hypothetical protein RC92_17615 [Pectobacterium brasiliense]|nr:hypothetical protein RC81_17625 [Pectobacterium brasiliense]KHT03474.1 hypothetical protein RC92_17615 [Pectobacterium brasiliense]
MMNQLKLPSSKHMDPMELAAQGLHQFWSMVSELETVVGAVWELIFGMLLNKDANMQLNLQKVGLLLLKKEVSIQTKLTKVALYFGGTSRHLVKRF